MKTNRWLTMGATALTIGSLLSTAVVVNAASNSQDSGGQSNQTPTPAPTPNQANTAAHDELEGPNGAHLRRLFNAIRHMAVWEHFDQFLGAQIKYKDAEGQIKTVGAFPGIVTAMAEKSVTVKLNDGSGDKTFTLPDPMSRRLARQLRLVDIGDKIVVITVNGEVKALLTRPSREEVEEEKAKAQEEREKRKDEREKEREKRKAEHEKRKDEQEKEREKRKDEREKEREKRKEEQEKRRDEVQRRVDERLKQLREQRQRTPTPPPTATPQPTASA